ncbi:hypothetical protein M422DRAFT_242233 [Sphaerobolus stellatus SS14]|nr:hypothetical protein M422DRAFT_242233 [Sphaerobolus stellatus SS14]
MPKAAKKPPSVLKSTPASKEAGKTVTRRKRDVVDPNLIQTGSRSRKPSERALQAQAAQRKPMQKDVLPAINEQSESEQGVVSDIDRNDINEDGNLTVEKGDSDFEPIVGRFHSSPSPETDIMDELMAAESGLNAAKNDVMSFGSEAEDSGPIAQRRRGVANSTTAKKAVPKKNNEKVLETPDILRLRVPSVNKAGSEVSRFLDLDYKGVTLDMARERIFGIIGCSDVPEENLPELVCQITKDKGQNYDINDWTTIKQRFGTIYTAEQNRKAGDPSGIVIDILLSPSNFLKSLHMSRQHQKKQADPNLSFSSGKGKNAPIKNLFATDGSIIGASEKRSTTYIKWERDLDRELKKCTSHEDYCKIDKYNKHRMVSDQQFRAWVEALANEDRDPQEVTLTKPPRDQIFEPWRVDIKAIEPSIPHRKDRRGDSAPPIPYGQNPQVQMPNFFILDRNGIKLFNKQVSGDSSSSPELAKKRRHSSSGSEDNNSSVPPVLTVSAWLQDIAKRPEAMYMNMFALETKLAGEEFLDVPLSFLSSLMKTDPNSLGLSLKERAFILQCLDAKKKKKNGKH